VSILGDEDSAVTNLSRCIFTVRMGNNDYLNNYFHADRLLDQPAVHAGAVC
jgi:hypothetical protein